MTPERKQEALMLIDKAHPAAGITDKDLARLRNLIDPPISCLSREELEAEVKELREQVSALSGQKELADALDKDFKALRQHVREWRGELLGRSYNHEQLMQRVASVAVEMLREFRKSGD